MADRIGQQLGNYRLIRLLGKGGFAHVYLGEHVHLHTYAAVKLLHVQVANDDKDSFLTEAQTIAQMDHPHIVRILDFAVQQEMPFLVMYYAPKSTLRQRHPEGTRLPLPTVMTYVRQMADALQYAHERKIIHRDVKPENMLVGRQDEILLGDFGIATLSQTSHAENIKDTAGTAAYMAPEQIQGKPRPASDQYSLAVVIYEWLCGKRPFSGTFTELCTQHLFATPPSLRTQIPTLPADVESVIMIALEKEPQKRFASIQAFARAFKQACQPETAETFLEHTKKLQSVQTSHSLPPDLDLADAATVTELPALTELPTTELPIILNTSSTISTELPGNIQPVRLTPITPARRSRHPLLLVALLVTLLVVLVGGTLYSYSSINTRNTYTQATVTASIATATIQTSISAYNAYTTQNGSMYGFDPERTNNNPYERIINTSNVSRLHMLWKSPALNATLYPPTVVNGIVYVSTKFGGVAAFTVLTGSPVWVRPANIQSGIAASPAVVSGIVYIGSINGTIYAFEAKTGRLEWSTRIAPGGFRDSPVIANGTLYIGSEDNHLYALDATSGRLLWKTKTGGDISTNPAVANGLVYVSSGDRRLSAFDAISGHEQWSDRISNVPSSVSGGNQGVASPAVANGVVYVGTYDGRLFAFDAATGKQKWFIAASDYISASPTIANNIVYVGSESYKKIYAFDALTGHLKWSALTDSFVTSAAVANGVVYVEAGSSKLFNVPGKIYAFNAATGKQEWSTPDDISLGGTPTIANGVVYAVSDNIEGTLYAFSL